VGLSRPVPAARHPGIGLWRNMRILRRPRVLVPGAAAPDLGLTSARRITITAAATASGESPSANRSETDRTGSTSTWTEARHRRWAMPRARQRAKIRAGRGMQNGTASKTLQYL